MASMGYVTIEGEEQGRIEGDGQHQDAGDLIEIFSFDSAQGDGSVDRRPTGASRDRHR